MDFVIIANAWGAGIDNPTSKHRIALELARRGHRVLWVEGAGMRTPSVGSGSDRARMARKIAAALRGARSVGGRSTVDGGQLTVDGGRLTVDRGRGAGGANSKAGLLADRQPSTVNRPPLTDLPPSIWVLSPLFVPLPKYRLVRWINGIIGAWSAKGWALRLGFRNAVLINYVPVLAEVMRRWGAGSSGGKRGEDSVGGARSGSPEQRRRGVPATVLSSHGADGAAPSRRCDAHASHLRTIYHCVDRWDAFAMYDSAMMAETDRRCCEYADVVIASSAELRDRCLRWNPNTRLVTHGVDYEHFRKSVDGGRWTVDGDGRAVDSGRRTVDGDGRTVDGGSELEDQPAGNPSTVHRLPSTAPLTSRPPDLPNGPVIGFFGLLSEWVDQPLLRKLAETLPRAQVVLIGKADVDVTALNGVPNIRLLGPRPFRDLPAYVAHFTVGLIPFTVNDLTRSVNPIKLREMLSGGCPVVSTALPEVQAMVDCRLKMEDCRSRGVFVAEDREAFVRMATYVLEHPFSVAERLAVSAGMAQETWAGKVDEILRIIGE